MRRSLRVLGIACAAAWLGLACGGESKIPVPEGRLGVLVFLMDTARADHFGAYGYERDTTPNVDALAREGVLYETVVAEGSSTFSSTSALMTGLSPAESGLLMTTELPAKLPTLAVRARDAGYRTRGYSENPFITERFHFDRGFDTFVEVFPHALFAEVGRPDGLEFESERHIADVMDWIDEDSERPFFAYFHILRPHNPYLPPPDIAGMFAGKPVPEELISTETLLAINHGEREVTPDELRQIEAAYDENLRYADQLFGIVLERLRKSGKLDHTLVVALSDHGEAFLDHGKLLHTTTVYDEMIHVPVVVRHPDSPHGVRIATPLQLRNVGQALAGWLEGLPEFSDPADPLGIGDDAVITHSWTLPKYGAAATRKDHFKLIVNVGQAGCFHSARELYDLAADPGEKHPLDPSGHPAAADLEEAFREHTTVECSTLRGAHEANFDDELKKRLEALGYVD